MKKLLQKILKRLARLILKRYRPKIVAITGSVGKTSTKEAIYAVLKKKHKARQSLKNYNNEIGVPLTIINRLSANHSFIGWLAIIFAGIRLLIIKDRDYPEFLILEMGADRPGDIQYLKSIVDPDIAVITFIAGVHIEYFGNLASIIREKFSLVSEFSGNKPILLNIDNDVIASHLSHLSGKRVMSYGFKSNSSLRARSERLRVDNANPYRVFGMEFTLHYDSQEELIYLPGVISRSQIYAALAAAGVGVSVGLSLVEIKEALKSYHLPAGRMKMLPGIKQTLIIDDTYNASPSSAIAAFMSVQRLPLKVGARRWTVLGDMLELGKESTEGHRFVGSKIVEYDIDYLITVGLRAKDISRGAVDAGMSSDKIYSFDDTMSAGKFLEDRMSNGDIILIKGSQGARMEKVVKEVMAEPLRAKELLVRQDKSWF